MLFSDEQRRHKTLLQYKGYPVRISTSGGKFFYYYPSRHTPVPTTSMNMFPSLQEAVTFAINEVEHRNQPLTQ